MHAAAAEVEGPTQVCSVASRTALLGGSWVQGAGVGDDAARIAGLVRMHLSAWAHAAVPAATATAAAAGRLAAAEARREDNSERRQQEEALQAKEILVAVVPNQLRHVREVHAVPAGGGLNRQEDRAHDAKREEGVVRVVVA
eukprot:CAMPEP_0183557690 /NCGR_PEP_ID=MMETSP0371-20130417/86235_1 /TAXON_ID=268820 /ORGANISM="Peridinium aciculiferum, Strain PAER-2" /LENGTH=141 /DNA_ID=CAMNT_0025764763 /DNA_START=217 /DNA_END=642 /DNA_ORIENTATION=-